MRQAYEAKAGAAVSVTVSPGHIVALLAVAVTTGSGRTVTVNGMAVEVQVVVELVTVRLKSYVPAGALDGMVMLSGEAVNEAPDTAVNPGMALVPVETEKLVGVSVLPV